MAFKNVHITIDKDLFDRKDPKKTWRDILKDGIEANEPWVGQKKLAPLRSPTHSDGPYEVPNEWLYWNGKEWVDDKILP